MSVRRGAWLAWGIGSLAVEPACVGQIETTEGASGVFPARVAGAASRGGSGGRGLDDVEVELDGAPIGLGARAGRGGRAEPPSNDADAGPALTGEDAGVQGTAPAREYCDAFAVVFDEGCGNGSCHTNRGATIGDFAAGPDRAARYVGVSSVRNAECGLIIDPDEPQKSLILTKVTGEYPYDKPCGGPMPVGSFIVTDEQIACISDWVEQFRR